jgi:hypothetical protein
LGLLSRKWVDRCGFTILSINPLRRIMFRLLFILQEVILNHNGPTDVEFWYDGIDEESSMDRSI